MIHFVGDEGVDLGRRFAQSVNLWGCGEAKNRAMLLPVMDFMMITEFRERDMKRERG